MKISSDPKVHDTFRQMPKRAAEKLQYLRKLILETAEEAGVLELQETLRWGEPSYIAKKGSTIRLSWSEKRPDQYGIYFQCTSRLVPTFKELYSNVFHFEKTRAILFSMDDEIAIEPLRHCLAMALQYHDLKKLPLLGN